MKIKPFLEFHKIPEQKDKLYGRSPCAGKARLSVVLTKHGARRSGKSMTIYLNWYIWSKVRAM